MRAKDWRQDTTKMNKYFEALSHQLKPRFSEVSAYLIALSFCWLLIFHPELRYGYYLFFTGFESLSPYFLVLGLIVTVGLLLSLIHALIIRKKLAIEKAIMGWSILGISSAASFLAGAELLPSSSMVVTILITWNILASILTLFQMAMQKYEISDDNASLAEVLITTAVLLVILLTSDLYLHFSWMLTFSICIFYATVIVFITTWIINHFDLKIPAFLKE